MDIKKYFTEDVLKVIQETEGLIFSPSIIEEIAILNGIDPRITDKKAIPFPELFTETPVDLMDYGFDSTTIYLLKKTGELQYNFQSQLNGNPRSAKLRDLVEMTENTIRVLHSPHFLELAFKGDFFNGEFYLYNEKGKEAIEKMQQDEDKVFDVLANNRKNPRRAKQISQLCFDIATLGSKRIQKKKKK